MGLAIAGAGITGAYLYRLFSNRGRKCDIYDVRPPTRCGISSCAWGTSRGFTELIDASGLRSLDYILRRLDHLFIDEVRIDADLMTFDKPRLIQDLLQGAEVRYSPLNTADYERVIDATGVARSYLPPIRDDVVLRCTQSYLRTEDGIRNMIRLGGIGYAWCFPLGAGYHIGCGSLSSDPAVLIANLGWLGETGDHCSGKIVCSCSGAVRLTGPRNSQPFVTKELCHEVWGVGEAIGCVAPLAGDGVVPGMKSVQLLLQNWEDEAGYTRAVLDEFRWMDSERKVVDKLRNTGRLGIADARVLRRNSRRMGMRIGLKQAASLLGRLR